MAKIYTKKGDQGETCLVSGEKVLKSHTRLESYGTLDELNSVIGLAQAQTSKDKYGFESIILKIQNDLFNIGSQLANTDIQLKEKLPNVQPADVLKLETQIDQLSEQLAPLKNFILPGGGVVSATLHVARTVCRRGERLVIRLRDESAGVSGVDPILIQYLNRLSDLLFVMARFANHIDRISDVEWKK